MQQWEYLIMESDMVGKVRKMRWRHGEEIANWKDGPTMYEVLTTMGLQGWELTSTLYTTANYGDTRNFSFALKRAKDTGRYSG